MTAITARLRRARLRLPAWRPLWRAIPARARGACTLAALFALLWLTAWTLAGSLTFLRVFVGLAAPAGAALLFVLITREVDG